MRHARALLLALGATLVSSASAAVPAGFEGRWQATGGDRAIEAGIDEVVREMSWYKRPIARSRLRAATAPCAVIPIAVSDGAVSIGCDDKPPAVAVPGGPTVTYTDASGDTHQVTLAVRGDRLVQTFRNASGARTNTYSLQDGELVLEVAVSSPRLPRDVTYRRVFAPAPAGDASTTAP